MSRRKRTLPGEVVLLFCTGRQTHHRRVLAEVHYGGAPEGPGLFHVDVETRKGSGKSYVRHDREGMQGAYALRCPSCKRDMRVNFERLEAITAGAVTAGLSALDVSNF